MPPPICPIKGPRLDMSSYYLNQLGFAGGHVPVASCFKDGQSKFIFIMLSPLVF